MEYENTPLVISVHNKGDSPVFGDSVTQVCIEDEAGGPFIVLKQCADYIKPGECRFNIEELTFIMEAAKDLYWKYPHDKT